MLTPIPDIILVSTTYHHSHVSSANIAPDHAFEKIWKDLDMPPMFVVDVNPFINVIVICDPFIADQLTQSTPANPYGGPPKSWTSKDLWPITGKHGLLTLEGEEWKATRKRFSPGFQPGHIRNVMLPMFVEQAKHFVNNIEAKFSAGEPFELTKLCQAFTLDVIGLMVLNKDFHTQTLPDNKGFKKPGGLL